MKKILVTGAAGFIGFHTVKRLTTMGYEVVGLDSLIPYYDVRLKTSRLEELGILSAEIHKNKKVKSSHLQNFQFIKSDLSRRQTTENFFSKEGFDAVIHLAAQPGVRESIKNPYQYIDSNINGLITILEACRHHHIQHLLFASSSSVYGNQKEVPFSETNRVDTPISLYAATKKSGELMAYTYAHLYRVPVTALRFFTVYGPWGRPDMAYFKFVEAIENGKVIDVFNKGELFRDFTYVDDVVAGLTKLLLKSPDSDPPYKVLNIGNSSPVKLMDFIHILEDLLGKKARINHLPMQPGDVFTTFANVDQLDHLVGFKPQTGIRDGLKKFVDWYQQYHKSI